jgi:DNA-binding transcriptional ArsR family regulator
MHIEYRFCVAVLDVFIIEDLETLKLLAEPTRVGIMELLTEPRSVTQLAQALEVPRTRLYHHVELLRSRGLIEVAAERRVGALTERIYAPTAKTYRPSQELLSTGDLGERVDAITTLVFDATKSDLRRSILSGETSLDQGQRPRHFGLGRSVTLLTPSRAEEFIAEVEALVARFDHADEASEDDRPFAFTWAFYPASRRIR